jgi:outer membrane protein W
MLQSTTKPLRYLPLIALVAGMLASAICSQASRADGTVDQKVGDIRLGVYYLENGATRSSFTSTIGSIGLDYILGESVGTSRSVLGVDYIERSAGGSKIQIIPLTVSEQYYHTIGGTAFTPYGEAGIGLYFVNLNDQNNAALASTHSETGAGAFIGGGIDISSGVFLDLRYHLIQNIQGDDPSGYQLTAGYRF